MVPPSILSSSCAATANGPATSLNCNSISRMNRSPKKPSLLIVAQRRPKPWLHRMKWSAWFTMPWRTPAPSDREAFILYAIEGFVVQEVAAITDRKADDVVSSINLVRERLRRSPPVVDHFRDKPRPSSAAD